MSGEAARSGAWRGGSRIDALVVGGSAGALEPLLALLAGLPAAFVAPMAVVLHQPRGRPSALAAALAGGCPRAVREAEDKERMAPSTVYVAPADYHLLIERGGSLALSVDEPVHFSLPSIDVLFESAARALGPRLAAVALSGANEDGARGLRRIHDAGGIAIVQSPQDAGSRVLPEAAIRACPEALVLGVPGITARLAALGGLERRLAGGA